MKGWVIVPTASLCNSPVLLYFKQKASHELSTATKSFLRQDGSNPGPSGIFHLQEQLDSPVLCPLPDATVPEEVTPPPSPLNSWGIL